VVVLQQVIDIILLVFINYSLTLCCYLLEIIEISFHSVETEYFNTRTVHYNLLLLDVEVSCRKPYCNVALHLGRNCDRSLYS